VTDPVALGAAFAVLGAAHGPVDVLVTCAGSATPGRFVDLDDSVFRDQMEVDYFGTLHAVRAVVPEMVQRRRGHVVLVASTVAFVGIYGYSAYAPAKHAVRGLAETLRPELRPHGITVACAYPPDTDTPGFARENEQKPEVTRRISGGIAPRTAASVAAAIVKGIESDRLVITADPTTAALARAGGALGPVLRRWLDRHVPPGG
jgi:3-dehydrosphinganine reductase